MRDGGQPRIDDSLGAGSRRIPASIAFAQLAEECRRAGTYEEAVAVAAPAWRIIQATSSARVTLGRALIELDDLDEAHAELEHRC